MRVVRAAGRGERRWRPLGRSVVRFLKVELVQEALDGVGGVFQKRYEPGADRDGIHPLDFGKNVVGKGGVGDAREDVDGLFVNRWKSGVLVDLDEAGAEARRPFMKEVDAVVAVIESGAGR